VTSLNLRPKQVEYYNAVTFTLKRLVTVPGLESYCCSITGCDEYVYLYLSYYVNSRVHRLGMRVERWSVAGGPACLSVNRDHNLVVACMGDKKLQE